MEYKIGQMVTTRHEQKVRIALTDEVRTIPAGRKLVIGADGLAHYLGDGCMQPLSEGDTVKGYSPDGIARYLCDVLRREFALADYFEEIDDEFSEDDIRQSISDALMEIGFYA